ncbi:MAG: hypothetical protein J5608_01560 [Alphaproteobacteria bacterium]|nr:hypothetical protein [Alphaproteobacteria bacterium]
MANNRIEELRFEIMECKYAIEEHRGQLRYLDHNNPSDMLEIESRNEEISRLSNKIADDLAEIAAIRNRSKQYDIKYNTVMREADNVIKQANSIARNISQHKKIYG